MARSSKVTIKSGEFSAVASIFKTNLGLRPRAEADHVRFVVAEILESCFTAIPKAERQLRACAYGHRGSSFEC